jgi:hypothetical protein
MRYNDEEPCEISSFISVLALNLSSRIFSKFFSSKYGSRSKSIPFCSQYAVLIKSRSWTASYWEAPLSV